MASITAQAMCPYGHTPRGAQRGYFRAQKVSVKRFPEIDCEEYPVPDLLLAIANGLTYAN